MKFTQIKKILLGYMLAVLNQAFADISIETTSIYIHLLKALTTYKIPACMAQNKKRYI